MRTIVISAVNLRSAGPLSILQDCLRTLDDEYSKSYTIVALVHRKSLFKGFDNIEFIEYPKSADSYLYRLFLEYFYFKKISLRIKPYLWFSLHDITPNVIAQRRAVYCHNAAPFYNMSLRDALLQPGLIFFNFLYKLFYAGNISCNDYVVVQQDWLRDEFLKQFKVDNVVVAYPSLDSLPNTAPGLYENGASSDDFVFVYPAFPRVFKDIEVICEAVELLLERGMTGFEVWLTVDGSENRYSKFIRRKYGGLAEVKLMGIQSREDIMGWYHKSDALIFPSKLETWGLPITEYKVTGKPMLVVDLPYARETVGDYDKVCFFSKSDSFMLADHMQSLICNRLVFEGNKALQPRAPFLVGWSKLFAYMLK